MAQKINFLWEGRVYTFSGTIRVWEGDPLPTEVPAMTPELAAQLWEELGSKPGYIVPAVSGSEYFGWSRTEFWVAGEDDPAAVLVDSPAAIMAAFGDLLDSPYYQGGNTPWGEYIVGVVTDPYSGRVVERINHQVESDPYFGVTDYTGESLLSQYIEALLRGVEMS